MIAEGTEDTVRDLERRATHLRLQMVKMLRDAGSGGHYGGGLSVMDILTVLYFHALRIDPARPCWEDRDRLVLSKGHACCALCPVLAERGFFGRELLPTFNKLDSPFGMHPDMHKIAGCDMSTGSLGHGAPVAVGMALAARYLGKGFRVYLVLSDGEMAEGSTWEALAIASHFGLDNLCATIDRNGFSNDGCTEGPGRVQGYGVEGTLCLEPLVEKVRAFGWETLGCDGHDVGQLIDRYRHAETVKGRPVAIIADTVKGKGISFLENQGQWHYGALKEEETVRAIGELEERLVSQGGTHV
jgi:transketolase